MTFPIASSANSFGFTPMVPGGGVQAQPLQPVAPQAQMQVQTPVAGNQAYPTAYTSAPVETASGNYIENFAPGGGQTSSTPALSFFNGDASIALASSASKMLRDNEQWIKAQMSTGKPMDESTVQLLRMQTTRIETINSIAKMLADTRQACMRPWTQN